MLCVRQEYMRYVIRGSPGCTEQSCALRAGCLHSRHTGAAVLLCICPSNPGTAARAGVASAPPQRLRVSPLAEDEWQVRFDCAQTEIAFLRKRLVQLEQRLESELGARTGLEQKASAAGPGGGRARGLPGVTPWSRAAAGAGCPLLAPGTGDAGCNSEMLMLSLTRGNQLGFSGLRINTPKNFLQA